MNKEQLKKIVGNRMRIRPIARRSDGSTELPQIDDDWLVIVVDTDKVELSNSRTGHAPVLGLDHIHSFLTDPARNTADLKYGFLQLRVQVWLLPDGVQIEPLPPGEWGLSEDRTPKSGNVRFKPVAAIEGDPMKGQQQYLLLTASQPFQVLALDYTHGAVVTRQPLNTQSQSDQRIPLLYEKVKPLTNSSPMEKEWAIDLLIRIRMDDSEETLNYPCLLQRFTERRILKLTLA